VIGGINVDFIAKGTTKKLVSIEVIVSSELLCAYRMSFSYAAVWFEPTDADKACKPFLSESWKALSYTTPNLAELCTMNHTLDLPTPT
ncbi:hypothetical protein cypCar_00001425, partial [Cyprinus carpio]